MRTKENLILNKTLDYSISIIEYSERKYVIVDQMLRSGCSIGANTKEAQNAEMKMAVKEADENGCWLTICKHAKSYPFGERILIKVENIIKVLNKIIGIAKRKPIGKLAR